MLEYHDPHSAKPVNVSQVHNQGIEANAALVRYLRRAPRQMLRDYLKLCTEEYSEAGLKNLHTLLASNNFPWFEDVLDCLTQISSPMTLEHLFRLLPKTSLMRKKKILAALKQFPLSKPRAEILELLYTGDAEIVSTVLELLDTHEELPEKTHLEKLLVAPLIQHRILALKLLIKKEGAVWLQKLTRSVTHLDEKVLEAISLSICDLPAELKNCVLPKLMEFPQSLRINILEQDSEKLPIPIGTLLNLLPGSIGKEKTLVRKHLQKTSVQSDLEFDLVCEHYLIQTEIESRKTLAQVLGNAGGQRAREFLLQQLESDYEFLPSLLYPLFLQNIRETELESSILSFLKSDKAPLILLGLKLIQKPDSFLHLIEKHCKSNITSVRDTAKTLVQSHSQIQLSYKIQEGLDLMQNGQALQASFVFKELILEDPQNFDLRYHLCRALFEIKDMESLETEIQTNLARAPHHLDSLKLLAKARILLDKHGSAISVIEQGLKVRPEDPQLQKLLCICHSKQKEYSKTLQIFFQLPEEAIDSDLMEQVVMAAYTLNRPSTIVRLSLKYPDTLSFTAKIYLALAYSALKEDSQLESIISGLKAEFLPNEIHLKGIKALADTLEREDLQELFLKTMSELHPDSVQTKLRLYQQYLKTDPQKILLETEGISEPGFLKIRGQAMALCNQADEALEILEELFLRDPSEEELPYLIAQILMQKQEYKKALKYLNYYEKQGFSPLGLAWSRTFCHYKENELPQTREWLIQALMQKPICLEAWRFLIDMAQLGLLNPALSAFLPQSKEVLQQDKVGLLKLALFLKDKNIEESISIHESVLKQFPKTTESLTVLAIHAFETGHFAKAYSHFCALDNNLEPRLLILYAKSALMSMQHHKAMELLIRLYQNPRHRNILSDQIREAIHNQAFFQAIANTFTPQDFLPHRDFCEDYNELIYKLGIRAYSQNKLEVSRQYLMLIDTIKPYRSSFFLGVIAMGQGNQSESRIRLTEALINGDKKPAQIHSLLGEIAHEQNDWAESKKHWTNVLNLSPGRGLLAIEYLFSIHSEMNSLLEFIEITKVRFKTDMPPLVQLLIGKACLVQNLPQEALGYFQKIHDASPYKGDSKYHSAIAYLKLQESDSALRLLTQTAEQKPLPRDFHLHYGHALLMENKLFSARQNLETHLDLISHDKQAILLLCQTTHRQLDAQGLHYYAKIAAERSLLTCSDLVEFVHVLYKQNHKDYAKELLKIGFTDFMQKAHEEGLYLVFQSLIPSKQIHSYWEPLIENNSSMAQKIYARLKIDINLKKLLLESAHKLKPKEYFWPQQLGLIALMQKDLIHSQHWLESAETLFLNEKRSESSVIEFYLQLANLYYQKEAFENCRQKLVQILTLDPNHVDALNRLSFVLGKMGDRVGRFKVDQKLFFANPGSSEVSERLIPAYMEMGDLQNSMLHLKQVLKHHPKDRLKWYKLAELSHKSGMHSQEIQALQALVSLTPDDKENRQLYLKMGNAWLALEKDVKASECFSHYLSHSPDNPALKLQLVQIYKRQKIYPKAQALLMDLLKQDSSNPTLMFELAEIYAEKSDFLKAVPLYKKTLEQKPFLVPARMGLAKILKVQGDFREALIQLDQVLKTEPQNLEAREQKASLYKACGMMAEAKQELEDLYTRQKKPNTLLEIAVLNLRQNHRDTALKQLKQVITDSPSEPRLQKLANSLLMKARTQSA